ncbi:bifunctional riboflavin kinase/FAD synthetase [Aquibacillus sediminis]|uniref:bifunctional riboflavin kinase/FAD synthetase n=1 Tax=Aquibacillus sediminis TaxID=2574734 RepID=UPI001AEED5A5|nr:bifunctional riboflavin kinase/FAD synthetase [Aquibacillus sediminis]
METIRLSYPHQLPKDQIPASVAAIGFFDGIHQGHRQVIQTAMNKAKELNVKSSVITFSPHPSVVLKQENKHVNYITPLVEKQEILRALGVERLYVITFNETLSQVAPAQFIDHFILDLNIKHLVAGFDFTYGHKGKGSMETIADHAKGRFQYTVIEKQTNNGQKISSTIIREYMENGQVDKVTELLGRALTVRGVVNEGDKRGRTIGYPTANIRPSANYLLPKVGVYAVVVKFDGKTYPGMANLGYKPTFHENVEKPSIEVHIFDYKGDLYGQELIIEWKKFIREEKKFNGIEELVTQLKEDETKIRSVLQEE